MTSKATQSKNITFGEFFFGRRPKTAWKSSDAAQNRFDYEDYYAPNILLRIKIFIRLMVRLNKLLLQPKVLNKFYQLSLVRKENFDETYVYTYGNLHRMVPTKIDSLDVPNESDPVSLVKRKDATTFVAELDSGIELHDWQGTEKFEALYWLVRDKIQKFYTPQTYFIGPAINRSFIHGVGRFPGDKYIPSGDVTVVEAGAYVGYKALGFARHIGPEGRVIAIESSPENARLLRLNCEGNTLGENIKVHCCAVWKEDTILPLKSKRRMQNTVAIADGLDYEESDTVNARSLDSLFAEEGLDKIDYLNLQLNGAEIEALEGLNDYFSKVRYINIITRYKREGELVVDIAKRMLEEKGCEIVVDWRSDGLYNLTAKVVH